MPVRRYGNEKSISRARSGVAVMLQAMTSMTPEMSCAMRIGPVTSTRSSRTPSRSASSVATSTS
jgi:hypothetical protein